MLKEICGCIHLHTTCSDGGCSFPTLIGAARDAGLDYICVTDHRTLEGRAWQGRRDGVFVLVGYEHNDGQNLNHYLAFGTPQVADESVAVPQEYIDRVKEMGGTGFLAHPAEKRDYLGPYPWTDWDVTGFDGIEIWNQISDWMEQLRDRWDSLWDRIERLCGRQPGKREWGADKKWWKFWKLFFPNRYIKGAPADLLERWDALNRERFVSGIAGVDAHTRKIKLGPFGIGYSIFPIKTELRGVRTHLFVDEGVTRNAKCEMRNESQSQNQCQDMTEEDCVTAAAIIEAMRDGRGFMSNFYRGDARGAKFFLRDENGNVAYPGRRTLSQTNGGGQKKDNLPSNSSSLDTMTTLSPANSRNSKKDNVLSNSLSDTLSLPATIHAELPLKAQTRLLRNGSILYTASGKTAAWPVTEPGVYRIEAYRNSRAWIYTNPFPIGQYPL